MHKHALFILVAVAAIAVALLVPRGGSGPVLVEPRRHSRFPEAYLVYTFVIRDVMVRRGQRGPQRMYQLAPTEEGMRQWGLGTSLYLKREKLLEHYRVSPSQLSRVPTRLPTQWLARHRKRLLD